MKLLYTPMSPFARKVIALAIERGISDQIALELRNPLLEAEALRHDNPLGKVPALVRDDGSVLVDSPVICEFLDQLGDAPPLIPRDGPQRWRVLSAQARADGVMDAAFLSVMEQRRPEPQRSSDWMLRWESAIRATTRREPVPVDDDMFDLGALALACALGYLDFRLPALDWRSDAPALADWYARATARDSLRRTAPPAT